MNINPDTHILFSINVAGQSLALSATLAFTWLVMALLVVTAACLRRRLTSQTEPGRGQLLLEIVVSGIAQQIKALAGRHSEQYLAFIGTLFVFIFVSNCLAIVPGYVPPTASLSTATALALCVFIAVPLYGIAEGGLLRYLRHYLSPTVLMLPFHLIGELSRTLALAVRLYGNAMSGTVIVGILLSLMPFFFPVVLQLLGLITGVIQAYIFAVLAMVYIVSASPDRPKTNTHSELSANGDHHD